MEQTLINPADTWTLWTLLITWAALSLFFEQRYKWGSRLSGPVIALIGGLALSNTGVIPTESPVYDTVWDYIVPMCIPLLLLKCDLRKIWRETGRMLGAFMVSAFGTVVGAFAAAFILGSLVSHIVEVSGIMTASYIGGAMNFIQANLIFRPPESISNALIVADNLVMAVHIMFMLALPGFAFAYRWFGTLPDHELYENDETDGEPSPNKAADYWHPKPISLLDIGKNLSLAFIIVTLATKLSAVIVPPELTEPFSFRALIGNKYLLFTSLTVLFVWFFPRFSERLRGTQEMGTFAIYIFFVLIGVPASIKSILLGAPFLLVFCTIMIAVNILVTFGAGKLFGFSLQEMILVSIANTAGPMNAAAIAISKKWTKLVLPAFLVGIWGYVIGTYSGWLVGWALNAIIG
ncbi:DUF819 domain-containing protein [Gemmatimonadota bacterium]